MADIRVELADGRVLSFPAGTDRGVIESTVQRLIQPAQRQDAEVPVVGAATPQEQEEFGLEQVGQAIAAPFEQETFGYDPDTEAKLTQFRAGLDPLSRGVIDPLLALGETGLAISEGIGAAIQGGAEGAAALARAVGLVEGKTEQRKLGRDLNLMAQLGTLIGSAGPGVRIPKQKPVKLPSRRDIIKAAPSNDALKETARGLYQAADDAGVVFKPSGMKKLNSRVDKIVKKEVFNKKLHPDTSVVINEARKLRGKEASFAELDNLRRIASDATQATRPSDARLSRMITDAIDDFRETVPVKDVKAGNSQLAAGLTRDATEIWKSLKKSEILDEAMFKAQLQASGYENGLRIQFRQILRNPKLRRRFDKQELKAIRDVEKGGKIDNALRVIGSFAINEGVAKNPLNTLGGMAAGGAAGGVAGAVAAPVAGQAARVAAQTLTARRAEFANALVRSGATIDKARKAAAAKEQLEQLGTFSSLAAENLARALAFGLLDFKGNKNEQ